MSAASQPSEEHVDIREPVAELCARLGIEPTDVSRIHLRPGDVTIEVFERNAEGKKFVDPTTQEAARSVIERKVLT